MTILILAMLAILVLASLVVLYVAYPHRGEEVPVVPWLGEAMERAAGAMPVLDEHEREVARR